MIFLGLTLLPAACQQHVSAFKEILASKTGTFWQQRLAHEKKAIGGYRFFSSGVCYYCLITRDGKVERYFWGDVLPPNSWHANQDTLVIDANKTKILHFSPDTIVLYYLKLREIAILTREVNN